jgi:hypothetical protein
VEWREWRRKRTRKPHGDIGGSKTVFSRHNVSTSVFIYNLMWGSSWRGERGQAPGVKPDTLGSAARIPVVGREAPDEEAIDLESLCNIVMSE